MSAMFASSGSRSNSVNHINHAVEFPFLTPSTLQAIALGQCLAQPVSEAGIGSDRERPALAFLLTLRCSVAAVNHQGRARGQAGKSEVDQGLDHEVHHGEAERSVYSKASGHPRTTPRPAATPLPTPAASAAAPA